MKRNWNRFGCRLFIGAMALVMHLCTAVAQEAVIVESNLVYGAATDYAGSNVSLTLDAYYASSTQTNRPVLILIHGGGFGGGDKGYTVAQGNFYPDMATAFATNGFVAFSINYRLWPGCPAGCAEEIDMAVADVMTALNWIRAHSADYGVDATKVLIGGDSAGGGLAINAAYRSTNVNSFLGCISLWGGVPPYGSSVHPVNTSPVTAQTPPTCLIHGTADTVVPYAISVNLSSNLTAAAVYNELHPLARYDHYPVMASNVYNTNLVSTIINDMLAFARLVTGNLQPTAPLSLGSHYLQVANGQFSFDITGPTNVTIAIERSTNLLNSWQAIATNQLPTGAAWFTNAILDASQFYRARIVSP
ncbi:MAG: alpha/beta hydrolase [Limisphaerales bacterium]